VGGLRETGREGERDQDTEPIKEEDKTDGSPLDLSRMKSLYPAFVDVFCVRMLTMSVVDDVSWH
jgi:hypothetical protein